MELSTPIFCANAGRKTPRASLVLLCWIWMSVLPGWSLGSDDLEYLREVQTRVRDVVQSKSLATVLVSDGIGSGSGVIVSPDGLVLTAGHVLTTGGKDFRITLPSGREAKAHPLGKNLNLDAGMVQIDEPGPWPFVELADARKVRAGDWVVCLGHPGGFEIGRTPPVRVGKIIRVQPTQWITDCALIGGDSGGPLFNLDGKLIGIHSSISDSIATNRHVSIQVFRDHWDRMRRGESWGVLPELEDDEEDEAPNRRAAIGVTLDLEAPQAVITRVRNGSPAASAGLQVGDVVLRIDQAEIRSPQQLIDLISSRLPGDTVRLTILRQGQTFQVQIRLQAI